MSFEIEYDANIITLYVCNSGYKSEKRKKYTNG